MKLELIIDDKKLIEPDFKIYTHDIDKELFLIAIRTESKLEDEIKSAMKRNDFNIEMESGVMGLYINECIYSFDIGFFLDGYLKNHVKNNFSVAFAFLDDNDRIKKYEVEVIEMTHK
ncbi:MULTISPECIES: hypothetical protein [Dickeya]|nr:MULTISPECIES: hypothetical protein [Dickeya]